MTIGDQKAAARKAALAQRKKIFDPQKSAAACSHLLAVLIARDAKCVSGYMPIRTEIDPRAALEGMPKPVRICLPVVQGPGLPLIFRKWIPGDPLIEGAFGAMIPERTTQDAPDVLIVPLAAFDARGFRLGYGGGYYDRTLENLRASGPVAAIGFAFAGQEVDAVPTEPTDQALDFIVTELGVRTITG